MVYWANSDAIAATLGDGWVHNGDAGYVDANPSVLRPIEITRAVQLVRRYHMVDEAPRFAP